MKLYIALLLVTVAAAQPTATGTGAAPALAIAAPAAPAAVAPAAAPNPFKAVPFQSQGLSNFIMPGFRSGATNPYNTKVYGLGINNRWARPHNIWEINRALQVANNNPNILVRVDQDGDVELTNQYGMEVENLYNSWGQDITDF